MVQLIRHCRHKHTASLSRSDYIVFVHQGSCDVKLKSDKCKLSRVVTFDLFVKWMVFSLECRRSCENKMTLLQKLIVPFISMFNNDNLTVFFQTKIYFKLHYFFVLHFKFETKLSLHQVLVKSSLLLNCPNTSGTLKP